MRNKKLTSILYLVSGVLFFVAAFIVKTMFLSLLDIALLFWA